MFRQECKGRELLWFSGSPAWNIDLVRRPSQSRIQEISLIQVSDRIKTASKFDVLQLQVLYCVGTMVLKTMKLLAADVFYIEQKVGVFF